MTSVFCSLSSKMGRDLTISVVADRTRRQTRVPMVGFLLVSKINILYIFDCSWCTTLSLLHWQTVHIAARSNSDQKYQYRMSNQHKFPVSAQCLSRIHLQLFSYCEALQLPCNGSQSITSSSLRRLSHFPPWWWFWLYKFLWTFDPER
jgi:hypothetical protein